MNKKHISRLLGRSLIAVVLGYTLAASTWAARPAKVPVLDFTALPSIVLIEGAHSKLIRNGNGVSIRVRTNSLMPGAAYTLWMVVFNFPGECGAPYACNDLDIGNPDVAADVMYVTGNIVGGSGNSSFAGHVAIGDINGSIFNVPPPPFPFPPAVGLLNPEGAELHFIVHSHGQKLSEYMPSMIQTFAGGCMDPGAPFIGLFIEPEWGVPGPNTCESHQLSVFSSPDAP